MLTFGLLLNSKYHHTIRLDRFVNKQKKKKNNKNLTMTFVVGCVLLWSAFWTFLFLCY